MELNEKLISLRKKNKLTQIQVAEALTVSRQAISNWETGAVLPSTDNLLALSRLYQLPVDHLLNGDADQVPAPVEKKEVDKVNQKEETTPETEHVNTSSKTNTLNKRKVITLIYLTTIILAIILSVVITLFITREKEPETKNLYDLDSDPVSSLNIEYGSFL